MLPHAVTSLSLAPRPYVGEQCMSAARSPRLAYNGTPSSRCLAHCRWQAVWFIKESHGQSGDDRYLSAEPHLPVLIFHAEKPTFCGQKMALTEQICSAIPASRTASTALRCLAKRGNDVSAGTSWRRCSAGKFWALEPVPFSGRRSHRLGTLTS